VDQWSPVKPVEVDQFDAGGDTLPIPNFSKGPAIVPPEVKCSQLAGHSLYRGDPTAPLTTLKQSAHQHLSFLDRRPLHLS
jgi:hypothetical protein